MPRLTAQLNTALALGLALALAVLTVGGTSALQAQERYKLGDSGWQKLKSPPPDSPRGRLQRIRKLLAQGHGARAEDLADRWIKARPGSGLVVEAYLLRGDAKTAQGDYYRALVDYEILATDYPASEQFNTALKREFQIAKLYVNGLNRKVVFGLRLFPAEGDGEELLIRTQERAPGTAVGEQASMLLGDYYFDSGQMGQAATAYELFLENYPQSSRRELAMLRLIQANLARYKGPAYDQRGLLEARQYLERYVQLFPAAAEKLGVDALRVRIRESLARRDLITANWYRRRGEKVSAATLYRRLFGEYPDTTAGQKAHQHLAQLGVHLNFKPAKGDQASGE